MDDLDEHLDTLCEASLDDLYTLLDSNSVSGNLSDERADAKSASDSGDSERPVRRSYKRKVNNSERCRRYRLKRQLETETLQRDNAALKQERSLLQVQLSSLQKEVTQLSLTYGVDLKAENELLRKQLMTYEAYVNRVVNAVNAPLWLNCTAESEQKRAIESVLDSAAHRLVGSMYSSMTSSSWKHGRPFQVEKGKDIYVRWMYQLIPLGSTLKTATQANLRFDIRGLPFPPEVLTDYAWRFLRRAPSVADKVLPEDSTGKSYWYNHASVEKLETPQVANVEGPVECTRIVYPVQKLEKEVTLLHATRTLDVYPMAYMPDCELAESKDGVLSPTKCSMIISTSAGESIPRSEESNRSVLGSNVFTKALAISSDITDAPHPVSKVTHLISVGLNDNSRSLWEKEFLFSSSQEGGISSFVELLFQARIQKMMSDLCEAT